MQIAYRESQYCASSANTIMLVANARTDHTRGERTCQVSKEHFDARPNKVKIKIIKKQTKNKTFSLVPLDDNKNKTNKPSKLTLNLNL